MGAFVIPSIFTAVDKMSATMKGIGASFTSMADRAETAHARMERSMKKISKSAMDISKETGAAGLAIVAPLMAANSAADDFETKMSNVATIVDTTKESMSDMGKDVLGVFKKVPVGLDDLTTGLYQVRSAAVPANLAITELDQSARLSVAGLSSVTEATNLMTSSFNVFKDEALTANQRADLFFKTVKAGKTTVAELSESFGSTAPIIQAAGVKMLDYQAATAALTLTGLKASEAQHDVSASVMSMMKPTGEMVKIFKKLGVKSGQELIHKMGGLGQAFVAVEKTGSKAGINLAKAWGRKEAFNAVLLLNGSQNKAYIQNLKDMASGISDVDNAFQKQMQTSNNIEKIAKNNAKAMAITIGGALSPVLDKLTMKLVPVIESVTRWMEKNPKLTETIVTGALAVGGFLLAVSGVSLVIGIVTKATWLWTAAQFALNVVVNAFPLVLVITLAILLIKRIAEKTRGWGETWASVVTWMKQVWEATTLGIKVGWLKLAGAFQDMVDGFVIAWKWGQNMIGNLSDEQYKKDIARIRSEHDERVRLIEDTAKKWHAAQDAVQSPEWKVREIMSDDASTPAAGAVNPKKAQQQSWLQHSIEMAQKQQVDVTVSAAPGTNAEVTKNTGGKLPKTTSTVGQR